MELGGFEPPTSWVRFKPAASFPRSHPAWLLGLRSPSSGALKLDMQGYAAIVGVFRQKCRFLPERATPGFNSTSIHSGYQVQKAETRAAPHPPPAGFAQWRDAARDL